MTGGVFHRSKPKGRSLPLKAGTEQSVGGLEMQTKERLSPGELKFENSRV